jgi:hypothetical protein
MYLPLPLPPLHTAGQPVLWSAARDHASACIAPKLTAGGICSTNGLLVIALAPTMLLVSLGWRLPQMSLHAPRPGSPLALLSSFKLFLIAIAIGGSGLGMSCA